jgi:SAM-dependent methyltransferase
VEPEPWKVVYFRRKIAASGYPTAFRGRLVRAVGERLPFADASFDLVTSYQTLEHVRDVAACLEEMLRVVRPGGVVYLRAPDYDSLYEPHYRVPFLPRMNRTLARAYLRLLGRPLAGLAGLQWVTRRQVVGLLRRSPVSTTIEDVAPVGMDARVALLGGRFPVLRGLPGLSRALLGQVDRLRRARRVIALAGRSEVSIDLWVVKQGPRGRQ